MAFPTCVPDATDVATPAESDNIFCIQAEIRAIKEYLRDNAFSEVPAGAYTNFIGTEAPAGWLFAAQEVSRATYAALFAIIADSYGAGDGTTTFALPNLYDASGTVAVIDYSAAPYAAGGATLNELPDGRLVFIGGFDGTNYKSNVYFGTVSGTGASKTITWAAGTSLTSPVSGHGTFVSDTGELFIFGGVTTLGAVSPFSYHGVISGNTVVWTVTTLATSLGTAPTFVEGLASKHYAFFADALGTTYDIDPATSVMRSLSGALTVPNNYSGVCALTDSTFLVAGGVSTVGFSYVANCYIATLSPAGTTLTFANATAMPAAAAFLKSVLLPDGRVLMLGLKDAGTGLACYLADLSGATIVWEDATTLLSTFLATAYDVLTIALLASGDVVRAAGHISGGAYVDTVKSWRPSRVIIKT